MNDWKVLKYGRSKARTNQHPFPSKLDVCREVFELIDLCWGLHKRYTSVAEQPTDRQSVSHSKFPSFVLLKLFDILQTSLSKELHYGFTTFERIHQKQMSANKKENKSLLHIKDTQTPSNTSYSMKKEWIGHIRASSSTPSQTRSKVLIPFGHAHWHTLVLADARPP